MNKEKTDKLDESLGFLEHYLADGYVAGSNMTIADFTIIATLSTLEAFGHDFSKFKRVQDYMEKLKGDIDGFQELNQEGADQFGAFAKDLIAKGKAE
jgi:glutathione S-transferase